MKTLTQLAGELMVEFKKQYRGIRGVSVENGIISVDCKTYKTAKDVMIDMCVLKGRGVFQTITATDNNIAGGITIHAAT